MKWQRSNATLWTCGAWSIEHMVNASRPTFELWMHTPASEDLQRMGTKKLHKFQGCFDSLSEAKRAAVKWS